MGAGALRKGHLLIPLKISQPNVARYETLIQNRDYSLKVSDLI